MLSLKAPRGELNLVPEDGIGDITVTIPKLRFAKVVQFQSAETTATRQTITASTMQPVTDLYIDLKRKAKNSFFVFEVQLSGTHNYVSSSSVYINGVAPDQLMYVNNANIRGSWTTKYFNGTGNNGGYMKNLFFRQVYSGPETFLEDEFRAQVYHVSTWGTTNYTSYINDRSSNDMSTLSRMFAWEVTRDDT